MLLKHTLLGLLVLWSALPEAGAQNTIRLSVNFIRKTDGTRPSPGTIGTVDGFEAEVARGNRILAATGRGYRLQAAYREIQPPVPEGQLADYWFSMDARANRQTIENAAMAARPTWNWSTDAINFYINDSSSGQCSFPGSGGTITLGNDIGTGTVLHEIGHFFDLRHTHAGDSKCEGGPYLAANGDALDATIKDHNCLDRDGISRAQYNRNYAELTAGEQWFVNTSWLNVMSYHQEDLLLSEQMDIWTRNANGSRRFVCTGRTWFVATDGSDGGSGEEVAPFATLARALISTTGASDVILLTGGSYAAPPGNMIRTPTTLCGTRGLVTIGR